MKKMKTACCQVTTDSNILFKEQQSSIVFHNSRNKECTKVTVDGCQITEGDRCDGLLVENDNKNEHFVELKGTDVSHALLQLERSISQLTDTKEKHKKVFSYIICVNNSPKNTSKIAKFRKNLMQKYHATLDIRERRWTVEIR